MKTVVSMNKQGRITVPASARRALRLEGEAQFEMEVTDDALILRPAFVIPREDAWAYTPEHLESMRRAEEDIAAGRVYRMTKAGLKELMRRADVAAEAGVEYHLTETELDELGERLRPDELGKRLGPDENE